jgi:hypothetical protein
VLSFGGRAVFGSSHWKLDAMEEYAGSRPAAWIDDNIDEECEAWAKRRTAPTLLVRADSSSGMTDKHVKQLIRWAGRVADVPASEPEPAEETTPPPAEAGGTGSRFSLPWRKAKS